MVEDTGGARANTSLDKYWTSAQKKYSALRAVRTSSSFSVAPSSKAAFRARTVTQRLNAVVRDASPRDSARTAWRSSALCITEMEGGRRPEGSSSATTGAAAEDPSAAFSFLDAGSPPSAMDTQKFQNPKIGSWELLINREIRRLTNLTD